MDLLKKCTKCFKEGICKNILKRTNVPCSEWWFHLNFLTSIFQSNISPRVGIYIYIYIYNWEFAKILSLPSSDVICPRLEPVSVKSATFILPSRPSIAGVFSLHYSRRSRRRSALRLTDEIVVLRRNRGEKSKINCNENTPRTSRRRGVLRPPSC